MKVGEGDGNLGNFERVVKKFGDLGKFCPGVESDIIREKQGEKLV